jgi:glucosamine--fructose-6-phosphate aminotransferase (isomerizing)
MVALIPIPMVSFPNPRSRPPFHMHDMILGQPAFVEETLRRMRQDDAASFLGKPRHLVVTGCGTSFHAATYGARVLQWAYGSSAVVEAIHAYDLLHGNELSNGATVLGVSHSGSTSATNRAIAMARRSGSRALALCGLPESPMDEVADEVLAIGSTHDHSWANTMSYTTQLTALAFLASTVRGEIRNELVSVPSFLTKALRCEVAVRRLAKRVASRDRVTFLGSGLDEITALEAALKIRETCSLPASGYQLEQFLHGPFLSLDQEESAVALRSRDDGDRQTAILKGLARTGAAVTTVGEGKGVDIPLPPANRILRPIVSVVPMQFLAYYAALERKTDPDIMRSDVARYRPGLEPLFH